MTAHPESQEPHRHPRTFRSGRAEYRAVLGLFIVFAVSRVLYGLAGVRFDTAVPLRGYMHFIDVRLLQHDLWNSLWHFHAQPPLFNLFLGMVLHLPGGHGAWFHVCFVTMGAALTVTMFLLMRELLRREGHTYASGHQFGQGPNWRLRVAREALRRVGLDPHMLQHGISREIYGVPLVPNWRECLRGEEEIGAAVRSSAATIGTLAVNRWLIPRAIRYPDYVRWTRETTWEQLVGATQ